MVPRNNIASAQEYMVSALVAEGIKIVFDAKVPYADLTNRVMHLRPQAETLRPVDLVILRGDCDHELGHFLHTDAMDLLTAPFVSQIQNLIEDGRVERLVSDKWLGCAENLRESNKIALDELLMECGKFDGWSRRRRAMAGLQLVAFGDSIEDVYDRLGEDLVVEYEPILQVLEVFPRLTSTKDTVEPATLIARAWSGWGNAGGAESTTKKGRRREDFDRGRRDAKEREEHESRRDGAVERLKFKYNLKKRRPKRTALSLEESLEVGDLTITFMEICGKLGECGIAGSRRKMVAEMSMDGPASYVAYDKEDRYHRIDERVECPEQREDFELGFAQTALQLRRRIYMDWYAEVTKHRRFRRTGRLDSRAMGRLLAGSQRVFRKPHPARGIGTEVTLLVDVSGSMTACDEGEAAPILIAAQIAAALSSLCDLIGVSNEVLAFTADRESEKWEYYPMEIDGVSYTRVRPLDHFVVKDRRSSFAASREGFVTMSTGDLCGVGGCNVDGESLLWAAKRLSSSLEPGKKGFIIVLSDGMPACPGTVSGALAPHLKLVVKTIMERGIGVLGIGIKNHAVEKFYPDNVVVDDISSLPETLFEKFAESLKKSEIRQS